MLDEAILPNSWRCWIAENALLELDDELIAEIVSAQGFDRELVHEEIRLARQHPYFHAADRLGQKLRKMESMLQVRVELIRQNVDPGIPCIYRLGADKFRSRFYAENRPVKLLGMLDDWPALRLWTPEHFRLYFGHEIVEITADRNSDPDYEMNLDRHRRNVRFADFIDSLSAGTGNDAYLVANNYFFGRPGMEMLLNDDIGSLPGYLNDEHRAPHTYLWFGPGGTITDLHHDTMNILFCQIYGRKRITLVAPDEIPWLYNDRSVYSSVKLDNADLDRYPLFQYVNPIEVIVNPGEVLFIPVGWWHHVRSLETSISVSFTNFAFPNEYHWSDPDIRR